MKITAIETIQNKNFSNLVWVKIHTDEGITGLGETFRNPNAIVSYIHESCAPYLLGKDPLRINEHADNLLNWTANRYIGYPTRSVEYRGNSAIDIALWDLKAKSSNLKLVLGMLYYHSFRENLDLLFVLEAIRKMVLIDL